MLLFRDLILYTIFYLFYSNYDVNSSDLYNIVTLLKLSLFLCNLLQCLVVLVVWLSCFWITKINWSRTCSTLTIELNSLGYSYKVVNSVNPICQFYSWSCLICASMCTVLLTVAKLCWKCVYCLCYGVLI